MVNRIWQHHFGRGIVRSASDFGYKGTPPTHPELLDWLASEFVARGWSLKAMHRLIVTSSAYRMSSRPDPKALAMDPENDLLWRFDLRRLEAEEVRDSILAVCGNLNIGVMGGPEHLPQDPARGAGRPVEARLRLGPSRPPRSRPGAASMSTSSDRWPCRCWPRSTRPTLTRAARSASPRPSRPRPSACSTASSSTIRPGSSPRTSGPGRATTPPPGSGWSSAGSPSATRRRKEVERGVEFLARMQGQHGLDPSEALAKFCLLALNLNEFVYLD